MSKIVTVIDELTLTEMARADLKGAEDAIEKGNAKKAASVYIKNAQERGLDTSKIISGLGPTFRKNKEGKVMLAKDVEADPDFVTDFKKEVRSQLDLTPKSKKKGKAVAKESAKDGEALKEKMAKPESVKEDILHMADFLSGKKKHLYQK